MEPYPDAVTYGLVVAASEVLGAPVPALLEAFGEYWTMYTAREGYGELLALFGSTLENSRQPGCHAYPGRNDLSQAASAKLRTDRAGRRRLRSEYHSSREGLAPMVVGLLKDLGRASSKRLPSSTRRLAPMLGMTSSIW